MTPQRESVLVVDDDSEVLTALDAELSEYFEVTALMSAEQALATLQGQAFSAIISDVRMPGIDGLTLIKECAVRYPDMVRLAGLKPAAVICEIMNEDGTMARVPELLEFSRRHGLRVVAISKLVEYRLQRESQIRRVESVSLPTDYGQFKLIGYESVTSPEPHLALCKGGVGELDEDGRPIEHDEPVLVRVHSECMTGDLFHSQRCECGYQLITAMKMIEEAGKGALVYLRQEGRGIGLSNKLRAYRLQEEGLDTVDANLKLGFAADRRDYGIGAQICRDLGLRQIRILTNNPKKISRLEVYGIKIVEQIPVRAEPTKNNIDYLRSKKYRLGHMLDEDL